MLTQWRKVASCAEWIIVRNHLRSIWDLWIVSEVTQAEAAAEEAPQMNGATSILQHSLGLGYVG